MDDLTPQLNIVVQSPEDGGSLSDPLNVIPDQYEDYEYDETDDDVVLLKTEDYEDYEDSLANSVDTAYSDQYETEDETDYQPGSESIPIVLEGGASQQAEALPSYDPVVLLVGTPEKVRSLRHVVHGRNHCKG